MSVCECVSMCECVSVCMFAQCTQSLHYDYIANRNVVLVRRLSPYTNLIFVWVNCICVNRHHYKSLETNCFPHIYIWGISKQQTYQITFMYEHNTISIPPHTHHASCVTHTSCMVCAFTNVYVSVVCVRVLMCLCLCSPSAHRVFITVNGNDTVGNMTFETNSHNSHHTV